MSPKTIAKNLSNIKRNCLIEHIQGPQPFHTNVIRQTKQSLVEAGLLRCPIGKDKSARPTELMLSELGREVICIILGEYADALVAAELLEIAPPIFLKYIQPAAAPIIPPNDIPEDQEQKLARAWAAETHR